MGQPERLDAYFQLLERHPSLFAPRSRRPLILERDQLEAFEDRTGTLLGVVYRSPYTLMIVDLVRDGARGEPYAYQRSVHAGELAGGTNVVVLPFVRVPAGPGLFLIRQERHATGRSHWELPRGFGDAGVPAITMARRELKEELGLTSEQLTVLGGSLIDTGLMPSRVTYVLAHVPRGAEPVIRERAIEEARFFLVERLRSMFIEGGIEDSFTQIGISLLQAHLEVGTVDAT